MKISRTTGLTLLVVDIGIVLCASMWFYGIYPDFARLIDGLLN
jgi:hypothetical protein